LFEFARLHGCVQAVWSVGSVQCQEHQDDAETNEGCDDKDRIGLVIGKHAKSPLSRPLQPEGLLFRPDLSFAFSGGSPAPALTGVKTATRRLILPDGQISQSVDFLSIPICKNISLRDYPKSPLYPFPSCPTQGRIAIVTERGVGCGGRGSVGRACGCRAGFP
jgi:hypothetical protein